MPKGAAVADKSVNQAARYNDAERKFGGTARLIV